MTAKLEARQLVPLTSDELEALREAAKVAEITPGLYSRALLGHAMALAAAGLLASAPAHADTLAMELDINSLMGFKVDVNGTGTKTVDTGVFNVSNATTGSSFLAFCYELLQGLSVAAFTSGETYTPGANLSPAVQTLYNQSFGSLTLTSAVEVAGFQIAL